MLKKLASTTAMWQAADPSTPVIPAIHYIVSTAQASPGKSGTYSALMPDSQIDIALALAEKIHGLVFSGFSGRPLHIAKRVAAICEIFGDAQRGAWY